MANRELKITNGCNAYLQGFWAAVEELKRRPSNLLHKNFHAEWFAGYDNGVNALLAKQLDHCRPECIKCNDRLHVAKTIGKKTAFHCFQCGSDF
ncbi:MAG: hypothetical protein KDI43_17810 [Gammaproteobacteria bacterium]|nr:hypothetical protein [Gammaproteobacteria bacterium]